MTSRRRTRHTGVSWALFGVICPLLACLDAQALPVTVSTPFFNLENRAVNSLGFTSGERMRIGAVSVRPNGSAGTTGVGSTVNLTSGQTFSRSIPFGPSPAIPDFFSRVMAYDPNLVGPWTMTFTNGSDTRSVTVSLPAGTQQAPFVGSITLSGTAANPTFSWAPPAGTHVDGYRINIFDRALINQDATKGPINNGQVSGRDFAPSVTSHTVTAADFTVPGYGFKLGANYTIEISLLQTRDGTSNTGNSNLKAVSRVYADFSPREAGGPVVNLPVLRPDGVYQFNMVVATGQTYYIDPDVAVGYDYAIGAGNPAFRSVTLPTGIGDGRYDLYDTSGGSAVLLRHDLEGGESYDFGAAGVTHFRVLGIETSANLDPGSTTAFVTGLSFTGSGQFTGTQTPIAVSVPEPGALALMLFGGGLLSWRMRRVRPASGNPAMAR